VSAQKRCESLFEPAKEPSPLSPEQLKTFKKGQMELARSVYELFVHRPDFRLQNIDIPGIRIQLPEAGKPLRYLDTMNSAEAVAFQKEDQNTWTQFAKYAEWKKSLGNSRYFKLATQPQFYKDAPLPTKSFGMTDIDFEVILAGAFNNLYFPKKLWDKYPQLSLSRSRIEGVGVYRQTWSLAYQNLMHYLRAILNTPASERKISLTPEQLEIVRKVYDHRGTISPITFVNNSERPGTFQVGDEAHRLAVTGNSLGSEILINTDFTEKDIDLPTATGLMLHELAHLHGYNDSADRPLDKVAALVADYIRQTSEVKTIQGPLGEEIQIMLLRPVMMDQGKIQSNRPYLDAWGSRIVLNDGVNLWDITGDVLASIPGMDLQRLEFFSLRDFDMDLKMMSDDHPANVVIR
jgi:hypothetical protein